MGVRREAQAEQEAQAGSAYRISNTRYMSMNAVYKQLLALRIRNRICDGISDRVTPLQRMLDRLKSSGGDSPPVVAVFSCLTACRTNSKACPGHELSAEARTLRSPSPAKLWPSRQD